MEELKLTVYFEDPFWVGVFERTQNGTLSVCKITFGAEPKDYAVHAYVLRHFYELRFSPALSARQHVQCSNPKRRPEAGAKAAERRRGRHKIHAGAYRAARAAENRA